MSGWQPIETAPKDGSEILVYGGHYDSDLNSKPDEEESGVSHVWASKSEAFSICGSCYYGAYILNPTHWMPLPPPP